MNPNRPAGVNANLQGALWMTLAGGAFTVANVAIRSAADSEKARAFMLKTSMIEAMRAIED